MMGTRLEEGFPAGNCKQSHAVHPPQSAGIASRSSQFQPLRSPAGDSRAATDDGAQRSDRSAVIRPQNQMPAQNSYGVTLAKTMTIKKAVRHGCRPLPQPGLTGSNS